MSGIVADAKFVRKEREHLDVLHRRLNHLREHRPERSGDPNYIAGEANALAWALAILENEAEPVEVRLNRIEQKLRKVDSEIGRLWHEFEDDDE